VYCNENDFWEIIRKGKGAGAQPVILVVPIEKIGVCKFKRIYESYRSEKGEHMEEDARLACRRPVIDTRSLGRHRNQAILEEVKKDGTLRRGGNSRSFSIRWL